MSYKEYVIDPVEKAFSSGARQIPFSLSGLSDLGVRQGTYTLLGGNTGSGKTTFVDQEYVLHAYDWIQSNQNQENDQKLSLKVLYYSMERRKQYKLLKWISWKIFQDTGTVLTSDQMQAYQACGPNMTPSDVLALVHYYEKYFDEMMDDVIIMDGQTTPKSIYFFAQAYAYENGTYYNSYRKAGDGEPTILLKNGLNIGTFSEQQFTLDKSGRKKMYLDIQHEGRTITMIAHTPQYFPHNPNEFVVVVLDHMGKLTPEKGQDKWSAIGEMSGLLGNLRDKFLHSPIAINQFNRSLGDVQRHKLYGDDLMPQLEDFEGQAVTQHDSDLILALFDPVRYKRESCLEYDMEKMRSPEGHNRFRSISVLKNTTGVDQIHLGMKFTGEVGLFQDLPAAGDNRLEAVYRSILQGN